MGIWMLRVCLHSSGEGASSAQEDRHTLTRAYLSTSAGKYPANSCVYIATERFKWLPNVTQQVNGRARNRKNSSLLTPSIECYALDRPCYCPIIIVLWKSPYELKPSCAWVAEEKDLPAKQGVVKIYHCWENLGQKNSWGTGGKCQAYLNWVVL